MPLGVGLGGGASPTRPRWRCCWQGLRESWATLALSGSLRPLGQDSLVGIFLFLLLHRVWRSATTPQLADRRCLPRSCDRADRVTVGSAPRRGWARGPRDSALGVYGQLRFRTR